MTRFSLDYGGPSKIEMVAQLVDVLAEVRNEDQSSDENIRRKARENTCI